MFQILSWISEVGNDTDISYIRRVEVSQPTKLEAANPYWVAVDNAMKDM